MLNLKVAMVSAGLLAGATATTFSGEEVLITNCTSDVIAYKYEKRLFRNAEITQLFSILSEEWNAWCDDGNEWATIDGKTATCERILQTNVTLDREQKTGRTVTTIVYGQKIGHRYYPPGGIEALADIGAEEAQLVRYDRKIIDFSQGSVTKKREQFLAPRGMRYTSPDTAMQDVYPRTLQRYKFIALHKNGCVI